MHLHARISDERGSFLLEAMIASTVVLIGLVGLGMMLTQALATTTTTKSREQGVSVQREIVEAARSISYDQLSPNAVVPAVQARPGSGLADSADAGGWTIRRRGITYSISLGVCSVDDPADGIGVHDPSSFCASGPGATSPAACSTVLRLTDPAAMAAAATEAGVTVGDCGVDTNLDGRVDGLVESEAGACLLESCPNPSPDDATPDDYKRLVTLVRWDRGGGSRYALQATIVPNPGLSTAPQVTDVSTDAPDPIADPTTTAVAFDATTDRPAAAVSWAVDGTAQGTASGSGTDWTFTWQLGALGTTAPAAGEVLDGPYVVGARGLDEQDSPGQQRATTVRLNRRTPYAPSRFAAGRNDGAVDFEWSPSPERDIEGYRVYRHTGDGGLVLACALTPATRCRDTAAPTDTSVAYHVVALDRGADSALREGAASTVVTVGQANTAPAPPSALHLALSDGNTVLTWDASPGDPDVGDAIDHYRIYRDGQLVADRFDRTSTGSELTFTDARTNGLQHSYWVVAVDGNLAESLKLGPVTG